MDVDNEKSNHVGDDVDDTDDDMVAADINKKLANLTLI